MNRTVGRLRILRVALVSLGALLPFAGQAPGATRSVESLVADKEQWTSYAKAGTPMTIEGRLSAISGKQLRFARCDLPFQSHDGKTFPRTATLSENVEVSGKFALVNAMPAFLVERLVVLPSDFDVFQRRRRNLLRAQPAEWYALGDWASARGTFYEDKDLLQHARQAYQEGIQREHMALPADAIDPLIELAAKARKLGLPETLRGEFVHEAWHRRWTAAPKSDAEALKKLAERMAGELAGCKTPLQPPQPKLSEAYLAAPVSTYRSADEGKRALLHRILYAEVMRAALLIGADPQGANGNQIADALDAQVPEFHELAESYREKELALRIARSKNSTRQDVVALAETLVERERPEQAREVLVSWLEFRTERLRKDGPTGLVQAADDYLSLLKDEKTAYTFLIEAYEIDPSSEAVARRLNKLGYELVNGSWLDRSQRSAIPEDPVQVALREGRVVAGMTADQVRKALGEPDRLARIASAGEVNEIWTYDSSGKVRLLVHIVRRSGQESRTLGVSQIPLRQP